MVESNSRSKHELNEDNYDYVILGTNLTENILGAGLAVNGEKCLFIDNADRYGGHLSNFNLEHYFQYSKSVILILV